MNSSDSRMLFLIFSLGLLALGAAVLAVRSRRQLRRAQGQNRHLRMVLDSANEGMYVTDRNRTFILWNRAAERITGYGREEVIGMSCPDNLLDHRDSAGAPLCATRCPLEHSIRTGGCHGPEVIYLRRKDGSRIPIEVMTAPVLDADGEITGGVEIFQDVTKRLERERLLTEKRMKLEAVLENICDGVLFIDHQGRIAIANQSLRGLFGVCTDVVGVNIYELGEAEARLRQAIFRLDHSVERPRCWEGDRCGSAGACTVREWGCCRCWIFRSREQTACAGGACALCGEFAGMRAVLEKPREFVFGGKTLSVLSSFIMFASDQIWEVLVFRDVTAEKLEAVVRLAGATAHELRQPLQILLGAVSLLRDEMPASAELDQYLDMAREGCRRMDAIIGKINSITRYETKQYAGSMAILDLHESSRKGSGEGGDPL